MVPSELRPLDAPDTAFPIAKRCVTIGRSPDSDIVVDDRRASRCHARVWREPHGYRLEDLDSLNGTFVNGTILRGVGKTLNDGDVIRIANAELRFEQPRDAAVGGRTIMGSALANTASVVHMGSGDDGARRDTDFRPLRVASWALKRSPGGSADDATYVLTETTHGRYLRITERDRFVWDRLDGHHTVRDLVFAYAREYGQLGLTRIQQFLDQLGRAGLLTRPAANADPAAGRGRQIGRGLVRALVKMELSVGGIDPFFGWLYRAVAWRFFTRTGLTAVWFLIVAGLTAFFIDLRFQRLFDVGSSGVWPLVAALAGYVVALSLHESAHALATKSYGRRVRRGGFMVMMAMPFAFVETSDMWLEGRRARIVVSLAGPVATAALAGASAIATLMVPSAVVATTTFHVALGLYINTLFNFNPLIPLDGYYVLADWLEMPRLRAEAGRYFRVGLWQDLVHGVPPWRWRWGLFMYGFIATVGMLGFLGLGVLTWRSRLGQLVHSHLRPPFDTVAVIVGVAVILFPVWFTPVTRLVAAISRRRRPMEMAA